MSLTPYHITVHKLTGREDAIEHAFACECETEWQALAMFDCVTRGVSGHYKAWLVDWTDIHNGRTVRESAVTWQD